MSFMPWIDVSTTLNHQKWSKNAECMDFTLLPHSVYGIPSNKVHRPLLHYLLDISPTQSVWKAKKCTQKLENDGIFPKWQAETPKGKSVGFFMFLALPPML